MIFQVSGGDCVGLLLVDPYKTCVRIVSIVLEMVCATYMVPCLVVDI